MSRRPEVPRARSTISNVVAAAVLLATVAAVPVVAANWGDWTSRLRDEVATIPRLQAEQQQAQGAGSESLLILVADAADQVGAIALISVADEIPPSLTVIPTSLFELLPGYGDFALADVVAFEGPELAGVTIANALGVRIDRVALLAAGQLGAALDGGLVIELTEPVLMNDPEHLAQIADAGVATYGGELVEQLLVELGESSQISWLERQSAVWQGLLDLMATDAALPARLAGAGPAAVTLGRAAAEGAEVLLVPVTPVAVAGADDGFQLVQVDVAAFVADRLSHLALAQQDRPRAEVLNGNGEILATRSVVEALVAAGFHVVKTDNADNFEFEETVVIAQGRANLDAAESAAGILGVRMVQLEVAAPSGVVDLSIIVGQDIATLRS